MVRRTNESNVVDIFLEEFQKERQARPFIDLGQLIYIAMRAIGYMAYVEKLPRSDFLLTCYTCNSTFSWKDAGCSLSGHGLEWACPMCGSSEKIRKEETHDDDVVSP